MTLLSEQMYDALRSAGAAEHDARAAARDMGGLTHAVETGFVEVKGAVQEIKGEMAGLKGPMAVIASLQIATIIAVAVFAVNHMVLR